MIGGGLRELGSAAGPVRSGEMIPTKNASQIDKMRESGRVASQALCSLAELIRVGTTTAELDAHAREIILEAGAQPAFLGYHGYPATICASVNDEVVHGIPSDRRLNDGDIVSVDVGVLLDGYYGDSARTFAVGSVSPVAARLIETTRDALFQGINALRPNMRLGELSATIQESVEAQGFSVVRQFFRHGIGSRLHEDPQVPNFGRRSDGPVLKPGTVLAIEPMVNVGTHRVKTLDDGWTVVTEDGQPSAHFEHTVAILSDGIEILTEWKT